MKAVILALMLLIVSNVNGSQGASQRSESSLSKGTESVAVKPPLAKVVAYVPNDDYALVEYLRLKAEYEEFYNRQKMPMMGSQAQCALLKPTPKPATVKK